MPRVLPPLRSHLYAPGNNLKLLGKVHLAGADAVIFDLEDAVPTNEKARARGLVAEAVRARAGQPGPAVFVRINHPSIGLAEEDIRAVVQPGLSGLRIPKVEDADTVRRVSSWVAQAEESAGVPAGSTVLVCIIESAAGVFRAYEIGAADPRVLALTYGAADLERDLDLRPGLDDLETLYVRSQLVLASRVAGVRPPIDTVFRRLDDVDGLGRSTRRNQALGFFGKSAIHPKQVATINAIYSPSEAEVAHARAVISAAEVAAAQGSGALKLDSGEFVDEAVVQRARDILRLIEQSAHPTG
ncbi:MAG: CoA ester lyase [Chloroflexota bacterium]|nr:MAG: CoA ester lyase [Chloroflexota bacterium]